jgi:hypothetical protein
METGLVLDAFTAVSHKLLGEFFNLVSLLLELRDRLTLNLNHLLEVVALQH